ncbi:START domain-containing protein [Litoribacillus peritrichatus]|uniref:START domain-containing protein n=2 Tax=Litoribacillus peritrichatus TaxID=718191 RepID=A0ABP7M3Y4_9GAMM
MCASLSGAVFADSEWKLTKEQDNILLYTSDNSEHTYATRIEAVIPAPLEAIVDAIEDPEACSDWLFRCQTAKTINQKESAHQYTYYIRDYPFPLKDRHGVIEISRSFNDLGQFVLNLKLMPTMTPEDTTLIVPEQFEASITLTKTSQTHSTIILEHRLNPGGKIPAWLKKSLHEEFPFKSVRGLIESAQRKQISRSQSALSKSFAAM